MRPGFSKPSFDAPLDVDAHRALSPPGATSKGMQLQALVEACDRKGISLPHRRRYLPFRDYPGVELLDLLAAAAPRLYPDVPLREALRRVGRLAYPTFKSSLIGRVVFAAVGTEIHDMWRVVPKAYQVSGSPGRVTLLESSTQEVVLRFETFFIFLDSWHVGILEGLVESFDMTPEVQIKPLDPVSADFWIQWRPGISGFASA